MLPRFGQIVLVLLERPEHNVTCTVTSSNGSEAFVTVDKIEISPDDWDEKGREAIASTSLHGIKDFADDGDVEYDVRVGGCSSLDPRFDGMGWPDNANMTRLAFENRHVAFPLVTGITPDVVHRSGRTVTVRGSRLEQNSTVYVGRFAVSNWAATESLPYSWKWDPVAQRSAPFNRFAEDPPQLQWPNGDVCEVLRHHGLLAGQWHNLPKVHGLLNFTWVSDEQLEFVTPCISEADIGYTTVVVELPDGRRSATTSDVADGIIAKTAQAAAELLIGDRCIEPGWVLTPVGNECRKCPDGAECV